VRVHDVACQAETVSGMTDVELVRLARGAGAMAAADDKLAGALRDSAQAELQARSVPGARPGAAALHPRCDTCSRETTWHRLAPGEWACAEARVRPHE
jgi:hypothetical protein